MVRVRKAEEICIEFSKIYVLMNKNTNKDKPITYSSSGVNYNNVDPMKRLAQLLGKKTAISLHRFKMQEMTESRGESAYVWEENDVFRAFVMEGLGTKNRIADEMRGLTSCGRSRTACRERVFWGRELRLVFRQKTLFGSNKRMGKSM